MKQRHAPAHVPVGIDVDNVGAADGLGGAHKRVEHGKGGELPHRPLVD